MQGDLMKGKMSKKNAIEIITKAERFYQKAISGKLNENDFDFNKDGTTVLKLNVLLQTLKIASNVKMIGDYNGMRPYLQTDKLAGGVNSCIGFLKGTNDCYIPNTILATDIKKEVTSYARVLAVLSKKISEKEYNKIEMVAKKIDINLLLSKVKNNIKEISIDNSLIKSVETTENTNTKELKEKEEQTEKSSNIIKIEFKSPEKAGNTAVLNPPTFKIPSLPNLWGKIKKLFSNKKSKATPPQKTTPKKPIPKPVAKPNPQENTPKEQSPSAYISIKDLKKISENINRNYKQTPQKSKSKYHDEI